MSRNINEKLDLGSDFDLGGLDFDELEKTPQPQTEKPEKSPKEAKLDAKDAYVTARDKLTTAYNEAWEKASKMGPEGSEAMFKLMQNIDAIAADGSSQYGLRFFEMKKEMSQSGAMTPKLTFMEATHMGSNVSTFYINQGKELLEKATTALQKGTAEMSKEYDSKQADAALKKLDEERA